MTAATPAAPAPPVPVAHKRNRRRFFVLFGAALAVLLGLGVLGILLARPGGPQPACTAGEPCPGPRGAPALLTGRLWRSDLGFQMEYYPEIWNVERRDARNLRLLATSSAGASAGTIAVWLTVAPASEEKPLDLAQAQLGELRDRVPTVAPDENPKHALLDPTIGSVDGIGGVYAGTVETPQGTGPSLQAFLMASTDDRVTVSVLVATTFPESTQPEYSAWPVLRFADVLLNTARWPSQPRPEAT